MYRVVNWPIVTILSCRADDPSVKKGEKLLSSRRQAEAVRRKVLDKLISQGKADTTGRRLDYPEE